MNEPHHLGQFETVTIAFEPDEVLSRRCPVTGHQPPYEKFKFFMELRWEDLTEGLSVNRSKFAAKDDVLWAIRDEHPVEKKCTYDFRGGLVFQTLCTHYPTDLDENTKVYFKLQHSPINCNISHCDILMGNVPDALTRSLKRDIKAFLASFFK